MNRKSKRKKHQSHGVFLKYILTIRTILATSLASVVDHQGSADYPLSPYFCIMLVFHVDVLHDGKKYHLRVVHELSTHLFDYYKVVAKNKTIRLRNNFPILNARKLKYREPKWEVVDGQIWNMAFKEKMILAIAKYLRDNAS